MYLSSTTEYFENIFTNLPVLSDGNKLNLANVNTYFDLMEQLHKYDNAESVAANLLTDYLAESYETAKSGASSPYAKNTHFFLDDIIRTSEFKQNNGPELFKINFLTTGYTGTQEFDDTLFQTEHEN
jgi:hypothetical protein